MGGRAADAARYSEGLCRAMCRGIIEEKRQRERNVRVVMEVAKGDYTRRAELRSLHEEVRCAASLCKLVEKKGSGEEGKGI